MRSKREQQQLTQLLNARGSQAGREYFDLAELRRMRRGFTLVELLVVIGIIGLLISILLPALSRARAQANRTYCMANLRQWGMGFTIYAQENRGFYAFEMMRDWIGPTTGTFIYWSGERPGTSLGPPAAEGPYTNADSILGKYLPNKLALFNDPAADGLVANQQEISATPSPLQISPCYGIPSNLEQIGLLTAANKYTVAVNQAMVRDPTETVLLADSATYGTTASGALLWRYTAISYPASTGLAPIPFFHGRHPGGGNVLWFDGHVSTEPVSQMPPNEATRPGIANGSDYNRMHLGHLMPRGATYSSPNANFYFWLNKTKKNLVP